MKANSLFPRIIAIMSLVYIMMLSQTNALACNPINYLSVTTPTGSRISGSGASFVSSASYSSGTSVDIEGTFSPNFNNFGNLGLPQTVMAAYVNGSSWYARNAGGWQSWDGVVANLPVISAISLPHGSSPITIASLSQSLAVGSYQVYFGYKWMDDTSCQFVVINQSPISITVN